MLASVPVRLIFSPTPEGGTAFLRNHAKEPPPPPEKSIVICAGRRYEEVLHRPDSCGKIPRVNAKDKSGEIPNEKNC